MPLFDMDPDTANALVNFGGSMMQAGGQPGASFAGAAGAGVQGMQAGKLQRQQLMAAQMQNQMGQLNLQRAQAMQPMVMNQINGMTQGNGMPGAPGNTGGNGTSGGGSPASGYAAQALMAAYASGNQEQISKAYLSLYEHDPALAGQIKNEQEGNTFFKTPEGGYKKGKDMAGGNNPAPSAGQPRMASAGGSINPPATTAVKSQDLSPEDNTETNVMPNVISRFPKADDGKPIISGYPRLAPPDPSGLPQYKEATTDSGVALKKELQTVDIKANETLSAQASSLQNEQFRLKELTDVYKQVQAGTLTAQNPELANKLVAWGVIKNPADIKDLAGVQNALQSHVLQIIQQIKDTNANMGGQPTRTFGSEINALQEKGEDPGAQPEALWNIIGQARGIVDHHLDMVKGWDTIGGLGNRVADGNTLRPDDYTRKFIQSHDITDYKTKAQKEMGPFKGMMGNNGQRTVVKQFSSPSTGKKKVVYSDGTEEIQ